jgi:hypothetical protein
MSVCCVFVWGAFAAQSTQATGSNIGDDSPFFEELAHRHTAALASPVRVGDALARFWLKWVVLDTTERTRRGKNGRHLFRRRGSGLGTGAPLLLFGSGND